MCNLVLWLHSWIMHEAAVYCEVSVVIVLGPTFQSLCCCHMAVASTEFTQHWVGGLWSMKVKKKKKKIIVLNWHARWQENIECHTCVFQCTSLFIVKKCKRERETDSSAELVCRNMAQSLTSHLQQPVIHRFKLWSTEIPCTLYFST